jgi:hypothetical protein
MAEPSVQPFETAEEAWLWYCQSQIARLEGARFRNTSQATVPRPCDPDDIFTVVDRLYKARALSRRHLAVLGDYGLRLAPPSIDSVEERYAAHCWDEAMACLKPVLKAKGIVL